MKSGHKIIVLGCSGSGKSTFSKKLQEATGLPLVHLDNIWWRSDRSHISREEFDRKLDEILQGKEWIVDGDYSRTYEIRFRSCDTVIFLDYSFDECMNGIKERVGKERTDIPWTEQSLDPELVKLVENYEKDNRPIVVSLIKKYPDKNIFVFKSRFEADEWLRRLM
jgi:adenylate kinase family enzyme